MGEKPPAQTAIVAGSIEDAFAENKVKNQISTLVGKMKEMVTNAGADFSVEITGDFSISGNHKIGNDVKFSWKASAKFEYSFKKSLN